jgi:hypothetical protein
MFEKAARLKIRYSTPKGLLTVEDLWDLPLTTRHHTDPSLDNIAKSISKGLKETETESFVIDTPKADVRLQLMFDIVKHVIAVRKEEDANAVKAKEKADQKKRLLEVLGRKKDAELVGKTSEELEAMINAL